MAFNFQEIKANAKEKIALNKKNVLVVGAILVAVTLLSGITHTETVYDEAYEGFRTITTTTTFSSLFALLVASVVGVGTAKAFINFNKTGEIDYMDLKYGFGKYVKCLLTLLLRNIFVGLWSILLIVPGIIKSLEWCFTEHVLAETDLEYKDAMTLSSVLTYNNKMNIFKMHLSLIGWYLLTGITCGIAGIYVMPLTNTCIADMYEQLKAAAIADGRVDASVFNNATTTVYTVE